MLFNTESPEYRGNGHYLIEGVEFMSVYTFKKKFPHYVDNSTISNSIITMEIDRLAEGLYDFKGIMEVGRMTGQYVQLHPVSDLIDYFSKKEL